MKTEPSIEGKQSIDELNHALDNARIIIEKSYLENLENLAVKAPEGADSIIDIKKHASFFRLVRLVTNKDENFLDKLVTIANAVAPTKSSLTTIVDSDGSRINYYIGIIPKHARMSNNIEHDTQRKASVDIISGAFVGNFSGSVLEPLGCNEVKELLGLISKEQQSIASVSGAVSLRNKEESQINSYIQGLENLTNALKGKVYTIVMIADPVSSEQIRLAKLGYEMLYTQLSLFQSCTMTFNESTSLSLTLTKSEGITTGVNEGVTLSQMRSTNRSRSKSSSVGVNAGISVGDPFGVFKVSAGASYQTGASVSEGDSQGTTFANSITQIKTDSRGKAEARGESAEQGKSLQISADNRSVRSFLEKIDLHIERLNSCENYGAFECAAYVISEKWEDALSVAGQYSALMRGDDSYVQSSQVNVWHPRSKRADLTNSGSGDDAKENATEVELIGRYLQIFSHPEFLLDSEQRDMIVRPSTLVSGKELAIQFALPKKSINGLPVMEMSPFGRNVPDSKGNSMELGTMYYMGKKEAETNRVDIDVNSLTAHTFITGSTGSGKSNTLYHVLNEIGKQNKKFMVIEPAKGEYKEVLGGRKDVSVWGTNPYKTPLLNLNPFAFPTTIHVLEHIDRLIEVFNACWPMYAAMPAILKDAVEKSYESVGWNLRLSESTGRFPTFETLIDVLPRVIEKAEYSSDTSSDYKGALCTRVRSLTNGLYNLIFCNEKETESEELFNQNSIVDLSLIGSAETKALIMGILILRLQECRMHERETHGLGSNNELRHITVLEEAHHLLRRTSNEQSQESSNLQGKSVEMIANAIAEMRTYGEGFIIADQSPGLLDMSVIRNTNTKIILRLPDEGDRQLVGKAAGLNEDQIAELARLEIGVAAVSQSNWLEPVLCKITEYTDRALYVHSSSWKDNETTAVNKFIRRAFDLQAELSKEDVDLIRKWYDRMENTELLRISELVLEGTSLNHIEKIILVRVICGKEAEKSANFEQYVDKAIVIFSSTFCLSGDDEVSACIKQLFLGDDLIRSIIDNENHINNLDAPAKEVR